MAAALPYGRLSAFYLVFFAVLGVLGPYWGPYLKSLGYEAAQIGTLIGLLHATKLIAPNLWGWVADRLGRRMGVIRFACVAAALGFAGVFVADDFLAMAGVILAFSFFWNATLSQFEANTLSHLGAQSHRYPRIRLWGTVGFMVAVLAVGEGIDVLGAGIVPAVLLGLFVTLSGISLSVPEAPGNGGDRAGPGLWAVLRQPKVLGLFGACFLLQASHGPFYAFYSIYLQDAGYSGTAIGLLWAVALLAEIAVFLLMPRWLPRFGHRRLLIIAMLLAVVRWVMVGLFPEQVPLQAVAQLFHAATYGIYHAAAISMVDRYFTGALQGRGQALYSSLTFGAGVAVGSFLAGALWDVIGGASTFMLAAGLGLAAALLAHYTLPRPGGRALSGA
jgi:PPP family 3-phenylpropionic acid transporter